MKNFTGTLQNPTSNFPLLPFVKKEKLATCLKFLTYFSNFLIFIERKPSTILFPTVFLYIKIANYLNTTTPIFLSSISAYSIDKYPLPLEENLLFSLEYS